MRRLGLLWLTALVRLVWGSRFFLSPCGVGFSSRCPCLGLQQWPELGRWSKKTKASGAAEEPVYPKPLFSMLAGAAFATYCLFSLTPHYSFGSGSWDMGLLQPQHLAFGSFKTTDVYGAFGDVNFMGDHFVPILALFAPFGIHRRDGGFVGGPKRGCGLGGDAHLRHREKTRTAGGGSACDRRWVFVGAGTQTMINFDFHEIALVPASLLFGFWAIESGKKRLFLTAAVLIFCSKESAIVYAGALGFMRSCLAPA